MFQNCSVVMAHATHKCAKISIMCLGDVYGVYIIGQKLLVGSCFLIARFCFFYRNMDSCQGQGSRESTFNLEVKWACVST